ncbi:hypothetical protein ACJX0J_009657 [Zea mays]
MYASIELVMYIVMVSSVEVIYYIAHVILRFRTFQELLTLLYGELSKNTCLPFFFHILRRQKNTWDCQYHNSRYMKLFEYWSVFIAVGIELKTNGNFAGKDTALRENHLGSPHLDLYEASLVTHFSRESYISQKDVYTLIHSQKDVYTLIHSQKDVYTLIHLQICSYFILKINNPILNFKIKLDIKFWQNDNILIMILNIF